MSHIAHAAYVIRCTCKLQKKTKHRRRRRKKIDKEKILLINNLGLWHFVGAAQHTHGITFSSIPHALCVSRRSIGVCDRFHFSRLFFSFAFFGSPKRTNAAAIFTRNHAIIIFVWRKNEKKIIIEICAKHSSRKSSKKRRQNIYSGARLSGRCWAAFSPTVLMIIYLVASRKLI